MPTRFLRQAGKTVLPDILANAGGVTASYFEWVQNRQHYQWGLNRVRQELDSMSGQCLRTTFGAVPKNGRLHCAPQRILSALAEWGGPPFWEEFRNASYRELGNPAAHSAVSAI